MRTEKHEKASLYEEKMSKMEINNLKIKQIEYRVIIILILKNND